MVGADGFEPPTSWSQTRRSTRLSYAPTKGEESPDRVLLSMLSCCFFKDSRINPGKVRWKNTCSSAAKGRTGGKLPPDFIGFRKPGAAGAGARPSLPLGQKDLGRGNRSRCWRPEYRDLVFPGVKSGLSAWKVCQTTWGQ